MIENGNQRVGLYGEAGHFIHFPVKSRLWPGFGPRLSLEILKAKAAPFASLQILNMAVLGVRRQCESAASKATRVTDL